MTEEFEGQGPTPSVRYKSVDKTLVVTIQMKATEQYFHVVLFIMLYKIVLIKL